MGDQSRLKLTYIIIGVALLEGIIKAVWSAFPLTEVFSLTGVAFGGYMTARTVSNIDEAKYNNKVTK